MALISPGVQVTVIDESQYQPTAQGTIAYVLLATAQDKTNPNGDIATYTTQANVEKLFAISSQRELVQRFGTPTFQVDASDNPINGDERNEYGLLAAYSALGVANRVYVQRANVDLAQLEGTSIRPTGNATDGTYWLDISADGTEINRGGIWVPIHTALQAWRVAKVLLAGPRAKTKAGQYVIFPSTFGLKANNINNLKHIVFLNEDRIFGVCEPE